jgi:hypothetical protein
MPTKVGARWSAGFNRHWTQEASASASPRRNRSPHLDPRSGSGPAARTQTVASPHAFIGTSFAQVFAEGDRFRAKELQIKRVGEEYGD